MAMRDASAHGRLPSFRHNDSALLEAERDELQHCLIETRIGEYEATLRVQGRFCSDCQHRLDDWPALELQHEGQPYFVRRYDTFYLEAAARSGCEFCACGVQSLLDSEALTLYRKVELKPETLESNRNSCLTIGRWGPVTTRILKMTLPGLEFVVTVV